MQIAIVEGVRKIASSGGVGSCPQCGSSVIAKCGNRVIHHWAHKSRRQCDPWWENETQWHRDWKELFDESCREVSHVAADGEIHRADIKTPTGIVIEVQHSSISDSERISRERFYVNMVWVIDGQGFAKNFDIYHVLPDPKSELAKDLVWWKAKRNAAGSMNGMFARVSGARAEGEDVSRETLFSGRRLRLVHSLREIEDEILIAGSDYYQYDWVRPRKAWLEAQCPVFIDFGDDVLVKLEVYDSSGLRCVRRISKAKFLHDVMVESDAEMIASKFYPVTV